MGGVMAILQRDYAAAGWEVWGLFVTAILALSSVLLWSATVARYWRQGQRLRSIGATALVILIYAAFLQPSVSQLGLYSSSAGMIFGALLALGAGLGAIAIWGHWRRWSSDVHHAQAIRWMILGALFLALDLAQMFIPGALPRPFFAV